MNKKYKGEIVAVFQEDFKIETYIDGRPLYLTVKRADVDFKPKKHKMVDIILKRDDKKTEIIEHVETPFTKEELEMLLSL